MNGIFNKQAYLPAEKSIFPAQNVARFYVYHFGKKRLIYNWFW